MSSFNKSDFYLELYNEIEKTKPLSTTSDYSDCFTSVMFEYLNAIEEAEDACVCCFRDVGVQINGFSLTEDRTKLEIFVSHFIDSPEINSVLKSDVTGLLNRGLNFYKKSIAGLSNKISNESDARSCSELITKYRNEITDVRIVLLTNGEVKGIQIDPINIFSATVKFQIWDIDRLYKVHFTKQKRDTVNIVFSKYLSKPLTAICGGTFKKTNVFLSVLPGEFLADLYAEYGSKLLERNVRAFLQFKSNVNKGIRTTLIEEPDMFLAYNNGITVTAESIEKEVKEDGTILIHSIKDMQIVNGGQTTVSLYKAKKDPTLEIDFSKVFVQMKLTVISDTNDMDEIVPKISLYSNNQNKVQTADFSSNDPYHRKMELISRKTYTTPQGGEKPILWFYERSRGQYLEELSKNCSTEIQRKKFKEENPLITKTDMAKVLCAWEKLPEDVSLGAQKCFQRFTEKLKKEPIVPSTNYYQHAIAKVILFRKIEKIVALQKFGGYKANIVAYTYYKLMILTGRRIDLDDIWLKQNISTPLENAITDICKLVQHYLVFETGGLNVSEYSKTNKCKEGVDEKIHYVLSEELTQELLPAELQDSFNEDEEQLSELTQEDRKTIEEIKKISCEQWKALALWGREAEFNMWQTNLLNTISQELIRGKVPSVSQAETAMDLLEEAKEKGFKFE